ncbi:hypothetical protein DFJ74DRAFT_711497 [Hyaloraphidium curvatum]|nr:hypothetical protein DFJ74DRAFT_711497 [Hyaloraphidium curvatum]
MDVDDPKKKRATRSCDACSHRKVRCDAASPRCERCERLDLSCDYTRPERKRGPPRGTTSKVHARLKALESLVSNTLGLDPKDIDRELGLPPNRTASGGMASAGARRNSRRDSPPHSNSSHDSPELAPMGAFPGARPLTPETDDSYGGPGMQHASAEGIAVPNIFEMLFSGANEDFGEQSTSPSGSSSGSRADYLGEQVEPFAVLDRHAAPMPSFSLPDPFVEMFVSNRNLQVPILPELIGIYFNKCAPFLPIIHRPSFEQNPASYPPLLVYSMYSMAAAHAALDPSYRGTPAADYWEMARQHHDTLAKPDVRLLQGIVLLIASGSGLKKLNSQQSDALIGAAVSMVRQMRLDIPDGTLRAQKWKSFRSPVEQEEAKRTLAQVWVYDIYLKCLLDRTASFDQEIETGLQVNAPALIEREPDWVGGWDRSQGPDLVANVQLFLAARDAIAINTATNAGADCDTVALFRASGVTADSLRDPCQQSLLLHRHFAFAHSYVCYPDTPDREAKALRDSEAVKRVMAVARASGQSARWYICGRVLYHCTLSMLLVRHGGHDFSDLILDLEAALMAVGEGQYLEMGSPFAAWAVFHMGAKLPVGHVARNTITKALNAYGKAWKLGSDLAAVLAAGVLRHVRSEQDELKPTQSYAVEVEGFARECVATS